MRIFILLLFCSFSISLSAQDDLTTPNGSVGLHVSKDGIGGFGEYYVKPNTSIWLTAGVRIRNSQLGFGADSSEFAFPTETIEFSNAQSTLSVRSGLRFYLPTGNPKWSFSYAPFVGYSNRSAASDEFQAALDREDLNAIYALNVLPASTRYVEAGGEVGLRWRFARRFYTQASFLLYYNVSLLDDEHAPDFDLTFGLGYAF